MTITIVMNDVWELVDHLVSRVIILPMFIILIINFIINFIIKLIIHFIIHSMINYVIHLTVIQDMSVLACTHILLYEYIHAYPHTYILKL